MQLTHNRHNDRQKGLQKGLSLVEVMIAMVIGSVITAGVIQLFVSNSETHRVMVGQSRMQESARFALEFIGRSVRQAGYRGCFSSNDELHTTIDPVGNIPYEYNINIGVQGYEATGEGVWSPVLSTLPRTSSNGNNDTNVYKTGADEGKGNGIVIDTVVSGSDVITLRGMAQQDLEARLINLLGVTDDIVVNVPPDGLSLLTDHLAVIHDCEKATVFRVTSTSIAAGQMTIGHDTDDNDDVANSIDNLALKNSFNIDASVSAIVSNTFFLAPGVGETSQGEPALSLWWKSGLAAPVELVEGVEDLQFLYGVSTNNDTVPNQYLLANQIADWKEVTTIRVTIVVNSVEDVGGTSTPTQGCLIQSCYEDENFDGLIRRSFSQTINLRNTS
jgi:type IV pilus assembly protein PilW